MKLNLLESDNMFGNEGGNPYSAIERDKKQVIHKLKRMFDETATPATS